MAQIEAQNGRGRLQDGRSGCLTDPMSGKPRRSYAESSVMETILTRLDAACWSAVRSQDSMRWATASPYGTVTGCYNIPFRQASSPLATLLLVLLPLVGISDLLWSTLSTYFSNLEIL